MFLYLISKYNLNYNFEFSFVHTRRFNHLAKIMKLLFYIYFVNSNIELYLFSTYLSLKDNLNHNFESL
jgi:hypothetical protein